LNGVDTFPGHQDPSILQCLGSSDPATPFRAQHFRWQCDELRYSTLESLDITYLFRRTLIHICVRTENLTLFLVGSERSSYNLSKATNLRDVLFRPKVQSVGWITMALQITTSELPNIRQVSVYMAYYLT